MEKEPEGSQVNQQVFKQFLLPMLSRRLYFQVSLNDGVVS